MSTMHICVVFSTSNPAGWGAMHEVLEVPYRGSCKGAFKRCSVRGRDASKKIVL